MEIKDLTDALQIAANISAVGSLIIALRVKSDVVKIKATLSQSIKGNDQNITGSGNTQVGGNYDKR